MAGDLARPELVVFLTRAMRFFLLLHMGCVSASLGCVRAGSCTTNSRAKCSFRAVSSPSMGLHVHSSCSRARKHPFARYLAGARRNKRSTKETLRARQVSRSCACNCHGASCPTVSSQCFCTGLVPAAASYTTVPAVQALRVGVQHTANGVAGHAIPKCLEGFELPDVQGSNFVSHVVHIVIFCQPRERRPRAADHGPSDPNLVGIG